MTVQVIADPAGRPGWISPALPGARHGMGAAREHGIIDALDTAGIILLPEAPIRHSPMSSGRSGGQQGMTPFVDLAPAADRVGELLPGISDEQLASPTPCAGMTVAQLLGHLLMLATAFRGGAEKAPDQGPPPAVQPPLPPTWRTDLPARLDALVTAWRVPQARIGTASVGGVEMPAEVLAVVALDELVLHGWDLAVATCQSYDPDRESVAACLGFVAPAVRPEGVPGLFGPPVPVPAEAPEFHRLVGLSGRDPLWRSPVGGAVR